jgi:hypothetical protein
MSAPSGQREAAVIPDEYVCTKTRLITFSSSSDKQGNGCRKISQIHCQQEANAAIKTL